MSKYPLEWRIIGCSKCDLLQIVRTDRKSRECPGCGLRIALDWNVLKVYYRNTDLGRVQRALGILKIRNKKIRTDVTNLNALLFKRAEVHGVT